MIVDVDTFSFVLWHYFKSTVVVFIILELIFVCCTEAKFQTNVIGLVAITF